MEILKFGGKSLGTLKHVVRDSISGLCVWRKFGWEGRIYLVCPSVSLTEISHRQRLETSYQYVKKKNEILSIISNKQFFHRLNFCFVVISSSKYGDILFLLSTSNFRVIFCHAMFKYYRGTWRIYVHPVNINTSDGGQAAGARGPDVNLC
jgi:hypothetical protein